MHEDVGEEEDLTVTSKGGEKDDVEGEGDDRGTESKRKETKRDAGRETRKSFSEMLTWNGEHLFGKLRRDDHGMRLKDRGEDKPSLRRAVSDPDLLRNGYEIVCASPFPLEEISKIQSTRSLAMDGTSVAPTAEVQPCDDSADAPPLAIQDADLHRYGTIAEANYANDKKTPTFFYSATEDTRLLEFMKKTYNANPSAQLYTTKFWEIAKQNDLQDLNRTAISMRNRFRRKYLKEFLIWQQRLDEAKKKDGASPWSLPVKEREMEDKSEATSNKVEGASEVKLNNNTVTTVTTATAVEDDQLPSKMEGEEVGTVVVSKTIEDTMFNFVKAQWGKEPHGVTEAKLSDLGFWTQARCSGQWSTTVSDKALLDHWFTSGLDDEFLAWRQERTSSTTSADTSPEKDRRGREKCAVVMEEDDAAARHHEILAYLQTEYMKPMKPENVPPVAAKKFLADRAMWERAIQKDLQYDRLSVEELMQCATICVLPSFEDWLRAKGQSLRVETTQSEESGSNHKASSTISVPNRPITALPLNKQETTPEEDELILAYLKRKCIEQERKIPLGQLHEILLWEEARWTDLRHLNRSISFFQSLILRRQDLRDNISSWQDEYFKDKGNGSSHEGIDTPFRKPRKGSFSKEDDEMILDYVKRKRLEYEQLGSFLSLGFWYEATAGELGVLKRSVRSISGRFRKLAKEHPEFRSLLDETINRKNGETTTSVRKKAKTQTRKRRAEAEVVSTKGAKVRSAKAFKIPMKEQAGDSALAFENFRKGARERKGKEHGDDKAYSSDCNGNLIDRSRAEKGKEREGVVLVADIASDGHIQRASGETAAAGDRDGDDSVVIVESDDNRGGEYTSSDDTVEILSSSSDEQKEDHYTKRTVLPADDDDLTLRDVPEELDDVFRDLRDLFGDEDEDLVLSYISRALRESSGSVNAAIDLIVEFADDRRRQRESESKTPERKRARSRRR